MQFFIIHPNPDENAKLLPDYAIKQVNVREGYQILSDIAHNLGITWEGQNKAYSVWHAETRRFMANRDSFMKFADHYLSCLNEYEKRFGKLTIFHQKYQKVPIGYIYSQLPEVRSHEEFMRDYMLSAKSDKMISVEVSRLRGMYK